MEIHNPDSQVTATDERPDRDEKGRLLPGHRWSWPQGQSAYVRGRQDSLQDHLRRLGEEVVSQGKTRNQILAMSLWSLALGGARSQRIQLQAIEMIMDRLLGKPTTSVKLGVAADAMSDVELIGQIQQALRDRGLTEEESQKFLLALGAADA